MAFYAPFSLLMQKQQKKKTGIRTDAKARTAASLTDMMDQGQFMLLWAGPINNANVVLYTVPPGRTFYFFGYDVNGLPSNAAVAFVSELYFQDSAGVNYAMAYLAGAIGCTNIHDQLSFMPVGLPAGSRFMVYADANGNTVATVFGVLI